MGITKYQKMSVFKNDIRDKIELYKKNIFTVYEIEEFYREHAYEWKLSLRMDIEDFIYFCKNNNILKEIYLEFPNRSIRRFVKNKHQYSKEDIAISLSPKAYFSHYSAVMIHDLSNNVVKNVFISTELSKKKETPRLLEQESINRAFSKPMRFTNRKAEYQNAYIYWLESKNYDSIGIIEGEYKYTDLERTLIDCLMRPQYCGGIDEVINIFEAAKNNISINKLYKYIKRMNPIYPYHQALGFILEYIGLQGKIVDMFLTLGMDYDFYLDYNTNINNCNYSSKWKLYYPKHLD